MNTKSLKQKILDLAIRGKLVPQDPNDEPASVLLQRIRAEREQLIVQGKIKRTKTTSDNQHYENVPFEIPASWEWVRLEDVVMAVTDGDHQPPPQASEGVPFLVISDVNTGRINFENARFVSKSYYDSLPYVRKAVEGDILFTVTGSYGIVINVDTQRDFCFQRHIGLIKTILCSQWLTMALQSQYVKQYCDDIATGTAQKTVSLGFLRALYIPIPPLAEQVRIVNEIEEWFKCIEEIEKETIVLQDIVRQAKSKILSLAISGKLVTQDPNDEPAIDLLRRINPAFNPCNTSHYENLPQGWTISTVGEVATYINGRAFKPSEWEQNGLPIIRIQNLNDSDAPYNYSSATYETKYLVKDGDLLFAWAASLGTYIWNGGNAWLNQHIFKVEPKEFIDKYFLYYSLVNLIAEFYRQTHGSGMVHITKGKFENTPILIPPLAEQKRIVVVLEKIYYQLDKITAEL